MAKAAVAAPSSIVEITQLATELQKDQAAKDLPPLTGVEVAQQIGQLQPPRAPAFSIYAVADPHKPEVPAREVISADGTIEDAVRNFNARRSEVRTAKQLRISHVRVASPEEISAFQNAV